MLDDWASTAGVAGLTWQQALPRFFLAMPVRNLSGVGWPHYNPANQPVMADYPVCNHGLGGISLGNRSF
jgi:hypothetical protein